MSVILEVVCYVRTPIYPMIVFSRIRLSCYRRNGQDKRGNLIILESTSVVSHQ